MNVRAWSVSLLLFLSTVTAVGQTVNRYLNTPLPKEWGAYNKMLSTREDIATYEVISSQGINMLNGTTSFWAEMIFE